MNTLSPFKRGDTFLLTCIYKEDGTATSISGFTFNSQLRTPNGDLVATLTATPDLSATGKFSLSPDTDTEEWPLNTLQCDIEVIDNGIKRSTITFCVPVVKDITQ
jgi:hypothetical protein